MLNRTQNEAKKQKGNQNNRLSSKRKGKIKNKNKKAKIQQNNQSDEHSSK